MSGHYTETQIGLSELIGSFRSNLKFSAEIEQKKRKKKKLFGRKSEVGLYKFTDISKFLDDQIKTFFKLFQGVNRQP